jgi:hypothetical protein
MGVFSRSWEVTKVTFSVMKKEKELYLFPILSTIFSLIFLGFLLLPLIISWVLSGVFQPLYFFMIFISYFGLIFIAVFFNVCVVYTSAEAFAGKKPKFWSTIGFAFSRIFSIFLWSVVSATVILIFKLIENVAKKAKGVGGIILGIFNSLFKMAWGIITLFVVPAIVYHNLGPFSAIKNSVKVLKKTWGESLVRYFGLGFVAFIVLLPGLIVGIPSFVLCLIFGFPITALVIFFVTLIYILVVALVFSVANSVFNTALYFYAETGRIPYPYTKEIMKNAFYPKK